MEFSTWKSTREESWFMVPTQKWGLIHRKGKTCQLEMETVHLLESSLNGVPFPHFLDS